MFAGCLLSGDRLGQVLAVADPDPCSDAAALGSAGGHVGYRGGGSFVPIPRHLSGFGVHRVDNDFLGRIRLPDHQHIARSVEQPHIYIPRNLRGPTLYLDKQFRLGGQLRQLCLLLLGAHTQPVEPVDFPTQEHSPGLVPRRQGEAFDASDGFGDGGDHHPLQGWAAPFPGLLEIGRSPGLLLDGAHSVPSLVLLVEISGSFVRFQRWFRLGAFGIHPGDLGCQALLEIPKLRHGLLPPPGGCEHVFYFVAPAWTHSGGFVLRCQEIRQY
ncbi:hypothetical protein, partial [Nocardia sp. 2TAF39]|uniref:hypothetical protein n=1 Tax=Nocardia sp. 2TAF39 TaxID=3233017 RepID=UPI003F9A59F2